MFPCFVYVAIVSRLPCYLIDWQNSLCGCLFVRVCTYEYLYTSILEISSLVEGVLSTVKMRHNLGPALRLIIVHIFILLINTWTKLFLKTVLWFIWIWREKKFRTELLKRDNSWNSHNQDKVDFFHVFCNIIYARKEKGR